MPIAGWGQQSRRQFLFFGYRQMTFDISERFSLFGIFNNYFGGEWICFFRGCALQVLWLCTREFYVVPVCRIFLCAFPGDCVLVSAGWLSALSFGCKLGSPGCHSWDICDVCFVGGKTQIWRRRSGIHAELRTNISCVRGLCSSNCFPTFSSRFTCCGKKERKGI